jgi:hypothetical protein
MVLSSLITNVGSSVFEIASAESAINCAAIIATGIFILVFIAISFRLLHETAAALLGAVAVFLVTYIGGRFYPALSIITFEEAMEFVDWNVIFLILGMMILMAILSATNVFRWLGLRLHRSAKGNTWLIVVLLVTMTGITSAFLNNVTAIQLIVVDVEDEISDMGEFLLLMAKERAAEQGVGANTICRKGNLRQEIKKAALEESVSMVLLGHPVSDKSAFQLAGLEKFAQEIESETGVKTEIV